MTSTIQQLLNSNPVDWSIVQRRIEENPDEIRWKDSYKRTVLHHACLKKVPLDVVVLLLEKHPDAARAKNLYGWLPLHYACCNGQSVAVIQLLVEAHPDALNVTNNNGKTPLQYAKEKNHADITAYLESVTPESVKTKPSEEQVAAMVDNKLNTIKETLKEVNLKIIELTTLTTDIKTCNETTLSSQTADLKNEVKRNYEKLLAALIAEIKLCHEHPLSSLRAELSTCLMKMNNLEKEVIIGKDKSLSACIVKIKKASENTI